MKCSVTSRHVAMLHRSVMSTSSDGTNRTQNNRKSIENVFNLYGIEILEALTEQLYWLAMGNHLMMMLHAASCSYVTKYLLDNYRSILNKT